jgi:hypothetical protein
MIAYSNDSSTPAGIRKACIFGLAQGLENSRPEVPLDDNGYVPQAEDNLVGELTLDHFRGDLGAGAGQELLTKFRAVYSSAALAVNTFATLRAGAIPVDIGEHGSLAVDGFERRFPTGLARAMPPHLDVVLRSPDELVAVESKCLEYLTPKLAKFSERYATEIVDERAAGPWFAEMQRLSTASEPGYKWLDAAQLIKHALGLAYGAEQPVTLVYLYWEPLDAGLSPLFAEHRQEIEAFADRVAGGTPRFEAMSYFELWNCWAESNDSRLTAHVAALRGRYEVPAWAWEGVQWKNGRLQSADWMMDLINEVDGQAASEGLDP